MNVGFSKQSNTHVILPWKNITKLLFNIFVWNFRHTVIPINDDVKRHHIFQGSATKWMRNILRFNWILTPQKLTPRLLHVQNEQLDEGGGSPLTVTPAFLSFQSDILSPSLEKGHEVTVQQGWSHDSILFSIPSLLIQYFSLKVMAQLQNF